MDNKKNNIDKKQVKEKVKINEVLKKFFSKKHNVIIGCIVLIIIIAVILFFVFFNKKDNKFALNEIYDVYPEEVRKLYSNMVSVGCNGDIHFNIKVDSGVVDLKNIDKNNLIDYMFSYMDKNNLLNDKIEMSSFKNAEKNLFNDKLDLMDDIKTYDYGEYTYNINGSKVSRKKRECTSDVTSVLHLYGYFWYKNQLSMDINVAYMKDGILYNYNNKKLGEYDGDVSKLAKLTEDTSYYRVNYVKDNDKFKLVSVEWKNRS